MEELEMVKGVVTGLDQGNRGEVEMDELKLAWQDPDFQTLIGKFPLPLQCEPEELFDFLDSDNDGSLDMGEFAKYTRRLLTNTVSQALIEQRIAQGRTLGLTRRLMSEHILERRVAQGQSLLPPEARPRPEGHSTMLQAVQDCPAVELLELRAELALLRSEIRTVRDHYGKGRTLEHQEDAAVGSNKDSKSLPKKLPESWRARISAEVDIVLDAKVERALRHLAEEIMASLTGTVLREGAPAAFPAVLETPDAAGSSSLFGQEHASAEDEMPSPRFGFGGIMPRVPNRR